MTSNLVHLIDRIDPNVAFVTELANVGCIVWRQREHLLSLDSSCDRNDKLIEFLTRRSVADYKQFIQVVARGEQSHLIHLLLPGGGQDILSHFYPRDAMLARVIEIATCLSVCLSICPSRAGIVSKRRKLAS